MVPVLWGFKRFWDWVVTRLPGRGFINLEEPWPGYNHLESLGYVREIIRQNSEVGENLLPNCHLVASLLKRWLVGTDQGAVSHEHLEYYLDEFTFRFNRRTSAHRGKFFYRLLQNAVKIEPVTYYQIKKNVKKSMVFRILYIVSTPLK